MSQIKPKKRSSFTGGNGENGSERVEKELLLTLKVKSDLHRKAL